MAIAGLILQVAFTSVMLAIWLITGSHAAMAATWMLTGAVALWAAVLLLFYTRQIERREAIELEEIASDSSIFQSDDKSQTRPMAARLAFIERWVIPVFTLLWAGWHGVMAVVTWGVIATDTPPKLTYTSQGTLFAILIGFLAFLFSRYSTGIGSQSGWRPLRPAGAYMLGGALTVAGAAVALLGAWQGYTALDYWVATAGATLMMILGVELVINFVLDMFRPRLPGQETRMSFDSRLLNLLAEPDRVGHSLADAVNYQFGFEVSRTWFYRLLVSSFIPLAGLGLARFHSLSPARLRPWTAEKELEAVQRHLEAWHEDGHPLARRFSSGVLKLSEFLPRLHDRSFGPLHRDLHPQQVLMSEAGVGFVDLVGLETGTTGYWVVCGDSKKPSEQSSEISLFLLLIDQDQHITVIFKQRSLHYQD